MTSLSCAIIIPARYASTRLPGKPLVKIAGITMLERVARLAQMATHDLPNTHIYVATDDARIANHCDEIGAQHIMTDPDCASGTDRVAKAIATLSTTPDFILNLQGDAPLTPPHFLRAMIDSYQNAPCDVVTPVRQLDWNGLDSLRAAKDTTPFSGTCAVFHPQTHLAYWFSKTIIPAIRKETAMREMQKPCPIHQHIGLYGYSAEMLAHYATLPESHYESLEGLEQLRLLEHGFQIRCVAVEHDGGGLSGVDSPEDVVRAEAYLEHYGDRLQDAS